MNRGEIPDNALWASILPSLRVLRIVAEQPLESVGYFGAPTLEQEMDRWVKWIRPFWNALVNICLLELLSKSTMMAAKRPVNLSRSTCRMVIERYDVVLPAISFSKEGSSP